MRDHKLGLSGMTHVSRRVVATVWAGLACSPLLNSVWAQYGGQLSERDSKPILEYFLTIGFTVLCVGIAAMNPKRSHQA